MIKVLVSGVGGDAGIGVILALKASGLPLEIHTSNSRTDAAGLWLGEAAHKSPEVSSNTFLPWLLETIAASKINVYIPTVDSEMSLIAENVKLIESATGCKILVGEERVVRCCSDKRLTGELLRVAGLPVLNTFSLTDLPPFDEIRRMNRFESGWVLKPAKGKGSENVRFLDNLSELNLFGTSGELIIQEAAPKDSREFTATIFNNWRGNSFQVAFWRKLNDQGSTYFAETVQGDESEIISEELLRLSKVLGIGNWNIQGKLWRDKVLVFEINPRFSGTTEIVALNFFNAPAMWLSDSLELNWSIPSLEQDKSRMSFVRYRRFERVY